MRLGETPRGFESHPLRQNEWKLLKLQCFWGFRFILGGLFLDFAKFKYIVDNFPISELTSKTNTIAHIFKKDYRENFICDWLAFLFDPLQYGGYEPLNAFLSLFPSDVPICFFQGETILIEREYAFKDGRRIDFLITGDEYIIGIENKIDS